MIISDMDKDSKEDDHWKSIAMYGTLSRDSYGKYSIKWATEQREITSVFNEKGRSMELSDLCNFGDKLYSFDDRTGMLIVIEEDNAYPVGIIMDGDGTLNKGFKGEWCTVRDDLLYIGGMGKEWTKENGDFVNNYPFWIKTWDQSGVLRHYDWKPQYDLMRKVTGTLPPGYLLHEAISWVPSTQSWLILPRRVSKEKYDATKDEYRCSNIGIQANAEFSSLNVLENIGELTNTRGFSSVKFVPHRENEIIVLKTEEVGGTSSYVMVYDLKTKQVLMPETLIPAPIKFEGVEFL